MLAILGGPYDGREITCPTAPDDTVPGYEAIIGGQERPSFHGGEFAAEHRGEGRPPWALG